MTPDEYAAGFTSDLTVATITTPRSLAEADGAIGASSFLCREQMRRTITKTPTTDSPRLMPAIIGGYVDVGVKAARKAANPDLLVDLELPVELPNGYPIVVHPDEVDPSEPAVTDVKTVRGLAAVRAKFAEPRYRMQRAIQYWAAYVSGLVPQEGTVRNVYLDRSGKDDGCHVEQEPFDMAQVSAATEFLDDVLYAIDHDEEAPKDVPRYRCEHVCPWFTACRGPEIVPDVVTDQDTANRLAALFEAKQRRDEAEALMEALKADGLEGQSLRSARHELTSVWVNSVNRASYWRSTIKELS